MGIFSNLKKTAGKVLKMVSNPVSRTLKSVSRWGSPVVKKIPEEDTISAIVSKQVYSEPNQRLQRIGTFSLDNVFNGEKHCVYVDDTNNKIIIGLRGTNPTDIEDLANDANIIRTDFFDENNIRFNRSSRIGNSELLYNQVRRKYPSHFITVSGHSLAGRMTLELARNHKKQGIQNTNYIAYNAGGFPMSTSDYPRENTKIYLSGSDLLSWGWNRHPSSIIVDRDDKPIGNNHGIDYFL
jgi:hypothetical protein